MMGFFRWASGVVVLASLTLGVRAQAGDAPEPEVLIVPVEGAIGVSTVALVRRGVSEARARGMAWLVLDVDTPGGTVLAMREVESMLDAIRESGVSTVAYVRHQALSAGGYLALACSQTFMGPNASIGAITPVQLGPGGMEQIPDDDARRKAYSAFRADVRALGERRGLSPDALKVAEAMVDPTLRVFEVVYEDDNGADVARVVDEAELRVLEARSIKVRSQQEVGPPPLTLTAEQALRYGFSGGTFDTIDDALREGLGVHPDAAVRIESSWSESAVDWLEAMKPFLFLFGFLLLIVEVKTPGFAVPGVLGVLLLGLGLFSSFLVGLAEWTEIILFFLGIALIAIEIFVLPGTIVAGLAGFLCVVTALVLAQQSFLVPTNQTQIEILEDNLANLLWLLVLVVLGSVLLWRFLPSIPILNRVMLTPPEGPRTGDASQYATTGAMQRGALVGRVGVAATDLRPSGIAEVGGARVDVVAEGGFIERGAAVRVLEVSGNRVVVVLHGGDEAGETGIEWLVLLLVVGLCLVIAEVFFVSFGILSIGAAVALVSAVFLAFTQHGEGVGFTFLALTVLGAPACIYFALKALPNTRLGQALLLSGPDHASVTKAAEDPAIAALRGKSGVAVSDLRPSGFARIDGLRVDVVTRGEMIENGTEITVVGVEGNRVVVAAIREATATE